METNQSSVNEKRHILTGIDELAEPWHNGSRVDFDQLPLGEMYGCIERNFAPSRPLENLSQENWRLIDQPILSDESTSREKILEKRISALLKPQWANQVPTASGYCESGGRKRSIDLVCESADRTFSFYELKVSPESGNALYATLELLGYGLLYIYSRRNLEAYRKCIVMNAKAVHLRVLGTWDYYHSKRTGPSERLQEGISHNVDRFASIYLPECEMDFGFDTFPREFEWSAADRRDDKKILSAVAGIRPLYD
jgi:hypothetical protein